jgi:Family of unknown function (DUF6166)
MSKDYVGTGHTDPVMYDVHVEQDGKRSSLTHSVRGSQINYQWDGGGPESTDLARALLWEVMGVEPEWRIYRLLKSEVVATWPLRMGECWRISEKEIRHWLAGVERDIALTESASRTEARLGQMHVRELRLKGFARMLGGRK